MAAAAILNFGKMSITPDWIKIYAPNFMWSSPVDIQKTRNKFCTNNTIFLKYHVLVLTSANATQFYVGEKFLCHVENYTTGFCGPSYTAKEL